MHGLRKQGIPSHHQQKPEIDMLKDLLAIVDDAELSASAIYAAVTFAELHDAHLALTVLTEQPVLVAAFDPLGYSWPEPGRREEHARRLSAIRETTAKAAVPVEVRGFCDEPALLSGLSKVEGRYADLVLVGPDESWADGRLRRHVVETSLLNSGAPALLCPEHWKPAAIRHAVLGWNASPEASRAARALMDLAEPGARIDIAIVDAEDSPWGHGPEPGSDIARHLARHGFKVEVQFRPSASRPVAEVLQALAVMQKADLLAIGAFAHNRLREVLLGGVTRDLVKSQRLPVLMAH
jgi:nucleotide-binding universal stress UspA family protein